jgi:hypothetical protein
VAVRGYDALIDQINKMLQTDRIMVATLSSVLAVQKTRIFQRGQDANMGKIGTYGTKPISIARKNQSRQTGKTYFKGGYREYKSLTGKGADKVNLRNTDQMMMDYGVQVLGRKELTTSSTLTKASGTRRSTTRKFSPSRRKTKRFLIGCFNLS